jgi:glycosyltransferase involved in cell wall biosynthesis
MDKPEFVSILIPCLNEEKFIAKCLDSIIANDYPKNCIEVLIIDGMSKDKTRQILNDYIQNYEFIKILDNPKKITPVALNIGIKHAKGKIIMWMCAHATYEKDYISKCVKYLYEYKADNVGGKMVTLPKSDTFIGRAIVLALSHKFGVGGAVFRTGSKDPKWVDTVFCGCYRREIFDKIGLYNEALSSTQDMEFNIRLKKAGGKILLHPEIVSYYYTRSDLKSFNKNNFRNGVWITYPMKFASQPVRFRHLVPLMFVLSLMGSLVLTFFLHFFLWIFLFIIGSHLLVNAYFSIRIALKENLKYLFIMPLIFAMLHVVYGLGSLWGLLKAVSSAQFWKNRFAS